jgi:hypothetical protein
MQTPTESDGFILAPRLSVALYELTGSAGPGHRALVQMSNDGKLPMIERRGRYLGCQRRRLGELAAALGLVSPPHRDADPPRRAA